MLRSYDTRLTPAGKAGAQRAAARAEALTPPPDVLVVSPLARAIQTAQLAWLPHFSGPVVIEPLARERVWLSSDVGSHPSTLKAEFTDERCGVSCVHRVVNPFVRGSNAGVLDHARTKLGYSTAQVRV
jgi:broad specificity phosphatase PhoE